MGHMVRITEAQFSSEVAEISSEMAGISSEVAGITMMVMVQMLELTQVPDLMVMEAMP